MDTGLSAVPRHQEFLDRDDLDNSHLKVDHSAEKPETLRIWYGCQGVADGNTIGGQEKVKRSGNPPLMEDR